MRLALSKTCTLCGRKSFPWAKLFLRQAREAFLIQTRSCPFPVSRLANVEKAFGHISDSRKFNDFKWCLTCYILFRKRDNIFISTPTLRNQQSSFRCCLRTEKKEISSTHFSRYKSEIFAITVVVEALVNIYWQFYIRWKLSYQGLCRLQKALPLN